MLNFIFTVWTNLYLKSLTMDILFRNIPCNTKCYLKKIVIQTMKKVIACLYAKISAIKRVSLAENQYFRF